MTFEKEKACLVHKGSAYWYFTSHVWENYAMIDLNCRGYMLWETTICSNDLLSYTRGKKAQTDTKVFKKLQLRKWKTAMPESILDKCISFPSSFWTEWVLWMGKLFSIVNDLTRHNKLLWIANSQESAGSQQGSKVKG